MQSTLDSHVLRTFRLNCKCFYGTWPQCDVDPKVALDNGIRLLPPCDWAVVAQEKHKDGTNHLHGIFYFQQKADIKDANKLVDQICNKHGNYQGAKSPKRVLRYVCKDNNYVTYGDIPDFSEKPKITKELADIIINGGSFDDCLEKDSGTSMLHKRKIDDLYYHIKKRKYLKTLLPWDPSVLDPGVDGQEVCQWLKDNIRKPRKPRQPQLYIYGPPGIGKTRFIWQLSRYLQVYHIPKEEEFYDDWEDGRYDVAVLDEYYGHKKLQWLNTWLDGSIMCMRQKGRQSMKGQNIPTIILSNFSPEEQYKHLPDVARQAFIQRLLVVQMDDSFNFFQDE